MNLTVLCSSSFLSVTKYLLQCSPTSRKLPESPDHGSHPQGDPRHHPGAPLHWAGSQNKEGDRRGLQWPRSSGHQRLLRTSPVHPSWHHRHPFASKHSCHQTIFWISNSRVLEKCLHPVQSSSSRTQPDHQYIRQICQTEGCNPQQQLGTFDPKSSS